MRVGFITNCDKHCQERFGTPKLINSFKYFHPDIPIYLYSDDDTSRVHKEYPGFSRMSALPCLMKDAKRKYNLDLICHLDSDSIVLDRLDEIIIGDYDIASVRNNNDRHTQNEGQNRPDPIKDLPNHLYVNAGCTATTSDKFLDQWIDLNKQIIDNYGGISEFWMCDQNMMNILFHLGRFKVKILDSNDKNVFYGASANIQAHKDNISPSVKLEYGENIDIWGSWQDIECKDGKFWLYGKQCKLIHKAGGGSFKNGYKLDWDLFNPKTVEALKKITNCQI
jgi:hypothetical protein